MEAFACGLVPVISNSPKSATVQFALDDRSLFEADNPDDLARKIDYWIENPEMKAIMSTKYAMQGNTYRVSESAKQAGLMFNDAINDFPRRMVVMADSMNATLSDPAFENQETLNAPVSNSEQLHNADTVINEDKTQVKQEKSAVDPEFMEVPQKN